MMNTSETRATVLYVEDEPDDVFFMRRAFDKEGSPVRLHCVADGAEALAYLKGDGPYADRASYPLPQFFLLDLNLPTLSGFDLLKCIRGEERFNTTPVVIFSSSGHKADRKRAAELGATAYFEKPSSPLDFQDFVRTLTRDWLRQP